MVEQNAELKRQLKYAYDKIEELEQKSTEASYRPEERKSIAFDYEASSPVTVVPKLDFWKLPNGDSTKVDEGYYDEFSMSHALGKEKKTDFVDFRKFKLLAESFPQEYQNKLEIQIDMLHEENKELERANKSLKTKVS